MLSFWLFHVKSVPANNPIMIFPPIGINALSVFIPKYYHSKKLETNKISIYFKKKYSLAIINKNILF